MRVIRKWPLFSLHYCPLLYESPCLIILSYFILTSLIFHFSSSSFICFPSIFLFFLLRFLFTSSIPFPIPFSPSLSTLLLFFIPYSHILFLLYPFSSPLYYFNLQNQVKIRLKVMLWQAVSRPVSLGVKRPSATNDQIFITVKTVAGLIMWGAFSHERTVCRLQLLLALACAVILGFEARGTHDHILLFHIRDSLSIEGQVLVFISPKNKVSHLYCQARPLHSQGCRWSIPTCKIRCIIAYNL
jgi:hypothetical protein